MALVDLCALAPVLRASRRLLGIDLGAKTLGLAISDGLGLSAAPLTTLRRDRFARDAESLLALCQKREVGGIVLGLPVNMDGSEGRRAQSTRSFGANLAEKTGLPIAFWDERLSTVAVTRFMLEADVSRARRAAVVDKMAAAYILQGALDRLRTIGA